MARCWVGTSGWSYRNWAERFYPAGLAQRERIAYYAGHFSSVELNASFYRLPAERVLAGWAERTPAGFLFAVKAWRRLTHFQRLADCEEPLRFFLERIDALGAKAGPVVFQLPPRFAADRGLLEAFLALLPRDRRAAFEFRDESWHTEAIYQALADAGAAFVPFELAERRGPRVATADFVYVRLHGREGRYRGLYDEAALADWAGWLGEQTAAGRDGYVYFDNTERADDAVRNAKRLAEMLAAG